MELNFESSKVDKPKQITKDLNSGISDSLVNSYNPPISRKLMEGICGISTNTLVKYETEGLLNPTKVKHGGLEIITYTIDEVQAVLKKRNLSFKNKAEAEVISVFSQKGGVGKSAFTQHLGSILSLVGRVLVIDLDSQSDATSLFGVNVQYSDLVAENAELDPTIIELIDWKLKNGEVCDYNTLPFERVVKKISPTLHIIPADLDLGEINYALNRYNFEDHVKEDGTVDRGVLYLIKNVVDKLKYKYDYILFDCPPNIETCNVNALFASNRVIIPLELEAKCLKTMRRNEDFLFRLQSMHSGFNWDKILVVPNKFKRENIKIKALAKLQDIYENRKDVKLSEAVFPNITIIDKCSENREPVYVAATKYGKSFKGDVPKAKELTDYFWLVIHELLDLELKHFIFSGDSLTAE
jgi:cellulose biosynthesis protein BcsQ